MSTAGIGLAKAQPSDGSGHYGNYGLCNAWGRGSATGQAQKQANGTAFQRLAQAAADDGQSVADYCAAYFPKPGGGQ